MSNTELRAKFKNSLRANYNVIVAKGVIENGGNTRDIEPAFDIFVDRMLQDDGANIKFSLSMIRGDADPYLVKAAVRRVMAGKPPFAKGTYPPGVRVFPTQFGDVVAGPPYSLFNLRGKLVREALRASVALVTSTTTARGLPRLGEFRKIVVGGNAIPVSSDLLFEGGLTLHSSPFLFEIRDADESVIVRDDLRSHFGLAVAGIHYPEELWDTYAQFTYDMLKRVQFAHRSIVTIMGNVAQACQFMQRPPNGLVMESKLKAIQNVLLPLEEQSAVANRAFVDSNPLGDTLVGRAIRLQVRRLVHSMLPVMFVKMAPLPESLEFMDEEHPLAVYDAGIRELLGDAGLGMFFDLQRYVRDAYVDSSFVRSGNVNVHVESDGSRFRFFDPISARLIVDALVYRVVAGNRRKLPMDLEFKFDSDRQSIDIYFDKAQPSYLGSVLKNVAELWDFKGVLECKAWDGGIRKVWMSHKPEAPSDGFETLRWDPRDLESEEGLPTEGRNEGAEAMEVSANSASSLIIPSATLAATLPLGTIK